MNKRSLLLTAHTAGMSLMLYGASTASAFEARPEHSSLDCYHRVESVNRIDIFGAAQDDVIVAQLSGPGEIKRIGDIWYWSYNAVFDDIGTQEMVKYEARRISATGASEPIKGDFIVSFAKLLYSAEPFFPTYRRNPTAYGNVPVRINAACNGLTGEYRIEVDMDGKSFRSVDNSYLEFLPDYTADTGKKLSVRILYRPISACSFKMIDSRYFYIYPTPMAVTMPKSLRAGEYIVLNLDEGSNGYTFYPYAQNLLVESDGFLADTAYKLGEFKGGIYSIIATPAEVQKRVMEHPEVADGSSYFILRVTNKAKKMHKKYLPIKITFTNPITHQEDVEWVTIVK